MELNIPNTQLQILQHSSRRLNAGLLWGGAMLAILTLWIAAAHPGTPRLLIVLLGLLAVAALAWAGWHLAIRPRGDENAQVEQLERQRRLIGQLLLGGGAILFLVAVWLAAWFQLAAFGQAVGLGILGLIALGAGWYHLNYRRIEQSSQQFFERLAQGRILARVAGWFSRGQVTPQTMRRFVLVVGGLAGLALTLTAFTWAWIWRNDVFLAGLTAWRGEQAWKLWLCTYLGLLGLALMFASAAVTRADIRVDPIFRRILYGYNAVFVGFLLLAFLLVLNILVYALYPMTFHWSASRGMYTLSESAKDILQRLEKPAKIYVLLSNPTLEKDTRNFLNNAQAVTDKLQVNFITTDRQFDELVGRYQALLTLQPGARRDIGRGLLVVYGDEPFSPQDEQPPHTVIGADQLFDVRSHAETRTQSYVFKGEEAVMSDLRFLSEGKQKSKIYFLQGNGELNLGRDREFTARPPHLPLEQLGMSQVLDRLRKENYEVRGLSFAVGESDENIEYVQPTGAGKKKEIPDDARVVVIAGPSRQLPKETLDALDRYMNERKGRLLVMMDMVVKLDPQRKGIEGIAKTGLEEWLKGYGVEVAEEYVHRLPPLAETEQGFLVATGDPLRVTVDVAKNDTLLGSKFLGQEFDWKTVRIIEPAEKPGSYRPSTLLQVVGDNEDNGQIWAENKYVGLYAGLRHSQQVLQSGLLRQIRSTKPLPVGVTVTETNGTPRLLVLGDAELASDREILGKYGSGNFNFLASSLDWLADRPGIGIRPKEAGIYQYPSRVSPTRMVVLPAWLMMLSAVGLGIGVWVVRRR